jgi:hypothetical protein
VEGDENNGDAIELVTLEILKRVLYTTLRSSPTHSSSFDDFFRCTLMWNMMPPMAHMEATTTIALRRRAFVLPAALLGGKEPDIVRRTRHGRYEKLATQQHHILSRAMPACAFSDFSAIAWWH